MIIQYLSDLHFEFGSQQLVDAIRCPSDVLVIAGDLHTSRGIIKALESVAALKKHTIFVPGNHEYYYSTKQYVDEILAENFTDHQWIHVLNGAIWEYKDVVFIGATGWWTMNEAKNAIKYMSDYEFIHDIKPANCGLDWGWKDYEFFRAALAKYDKRITGKTVICVSHNAPSVKSIGAPFLGSNLNPCFVNAWEHLILSYKPDVWIHGHTHDVKDYQFDNTRVLCNPYGYENINGGRGQLAKDFDACKIICLSGPVL